MDSTICVPILDIHGNVIAVIQAINKLGTDSSTIMIEGENMDNNTSTIKNAKGKFLITYTVNKQTIKNCYY